MCDMFDVDLILQLGYTKKQEERHFRGVINLEVRSPLYFHEIRTNSGLFAFCAWPWILRFKCCILWVVYLLPSLPNKVTNKHHFQIQVANWSPLVFKLLQLHQASLEQVIFVTIWYPLTFYLLVNDSPYKNFFDRKRQRHILI